MNFDERSENGDWIHSGDERSKHKAMQHFELGTAVERREIKCIQSATNAERVEQRIDYSE